MGSETTRGGFYRARLIVVCLRQTLAAVRLKEVAHFTGLYKRFVKVFEAFVRLDPLTRSPQSSTTVGGLPGEDSGEVWMK